MRPELLEMTAFGSFRHKTVIDFKKFNREAFLITGDTGAGKTTIFDAIVYALYGTLSSSGEKSREASKMHCLQCPKSEDAVVDFYFSHQGKDYRITRTIHYEKKQNSDNEYNEIPKQKAVFYDSEGKAVVNTSTKVTQRVNELIGFSVDQFLKIVVLAQGEFKAFLKAGGDKKAEILGSLFGSDIYVYYERLFKEAEGKLSKEREGANTRIDVAMTSTFKKPEWEMYKEEDWIPGNPELLLRLGELLKEEKILKESADREEADLTEQKEKLISTIEEVKTINKKIENLKDNQTKEKMLLQTISEDKIIEDDTSEEYIMQIRDGLVGEIQNLQETLKKYADYKRMEKEVKKLTEKEERLKNTKAELAGKEEVNENRLKELEEKLKEFADAEVALEKASQNVKKAKEVLDIFQELASGKELLEKNMAQLKTVERKLEEQALNTVQAFDDYADLNKRFLNGQAGILGSKLQEEIDKNGESECPVCKTHFTKGEFYPFAVKEQDVPSEKEVEDANRNYHEENKKREVLHTEKTQWESVIENQKNTLVEQCKKCDSDCIDWGIFSEERYLVNKISSAEAEWNRMKEVEKEAQKKKNEKVATEKALKETEKTKESLREEKEDIEKEYHITQNQLTEKQTRLQENEKTVTFQSESEIQREISEKEMERDLLNNLLNIRKEIHRLEEETRDCNVTDMAMLEDKKTALETEILEKKKVIKELGICISNHETVYENVKAEKEVLAKTDYAATLLGKLSGKANGENAEGGRLSFSRYILSTVFKEIVDKANDWLDTMSGGRYELIHIMEAENKNKIAGFELEARDILNGNSLDASMLSGGESFLVSMSLALGLSDVVRFEAGGMDMETLFIDEGFGTLDEKTLDNVNIVLHTLKERGSMVGIITHVGRLEEAISKGINVTYDFRTGSSIRYVGM